MDIAITSSPSPIHTHTNVNAVRPGPSSYVSYGRPPAPSGVGRGRGRGRGRGAAAAAARNASLQHQQQQLLQQQQQQQQRPVTPPFVYLQRPNGPNGIPNGTNGIGTSPSSSDSSVLPPNHIHIVQSQQNDPRMNRTNSTFSLTSVPPLSNGPSSTEDSFGEIESYQTSPYQVYQPSTLTKEVGLIKDVELAESPIEPGYAIQAINHFADSLRCMQGATFDEWDSFIDEHFEQSARFQLNIHTGDALKSFDVPIISLPRFFLTISGEDNNLSHELVLGEISEPAIGSVESEHVEWSYGAQPLKGNLSAELAMSGGGAGILRLGRLELSLQVVEGTFPESALRILEIAQQMDCMMEVIDLVEEDKLDPQDALKRLDQDTDTDTEIGGVSIHDTNT